MGSQDSRSGYRPASGVEAGAEDAGALSSLVMTAPSSTLAAILSVSIKVNSKTRK